MSDLFEDRDHKVLVAEEDADAFVASYGDHQGRFWRSRLMC
jgi:hypothetical protein